MGLSVFWGLSGRPSQAGTLGHKFGANPEGSVKQMLDFGKVILAAEKRAETLQKRFNLVQTDR